MSLGTFDTVVIGGGLHGISAALHLAPAGQTVALVERAWIGRHASGASAAGVRTLGRQFAELPLSLAAMEMWHRIGELVGEDCGFEAHGQIKVAATEADLAALAARVRKLEEMGYSHEKLIDRATLRALVPGIAEHFVGATHSPRDGAADPHKTIMAFRSRAESAGVRIFEATAVKGVERSGGDWLVKTGTGDLTAHSVVNAAGAWGARIAALVGDAVPLSAKASMMIVTERVAHFVRPVLSIVGRSLSFKQTGQGTLVIGGGLQGRYDLDGENTFIDFHRLSEGAKAARELIPTVGDLRVIRCWSGIEGKTEDLLPVIGPSPSAERFFHVFGFSGHGFQLVPAVGAAVAEMVVSGRVPAMLQPFSPLRLMKMGAAA